VSARLAAPILALAAVAGWAGSARSVPSAPPDSAHNVVAIEFLDSPASGFAVSGGLLGVPDSAGHFPERYQRSDPVTGRLARPGRGAGDLLVFTDLEPGTYRVALVFLGESKLAKEFLPKDKTLTEDLCMVYGDTLSHLTFTVANGQALFLGRVTRHTRPSFDDKNELWRSWVEWSAGDEGKALQSLVKRKDMAPWKGLLSAALEQVRAATAPHR
jgi:hypothetical protein